MANKKSVVEIDIQDSKWKSFVAEFAKFGIDNKKIAEDLAESAAAQAKLNTEKKKGAAAQKAVSKEEKTERDAAAKAAKTAYDDERKKFAAQTKASDEKKKQRADDMKALRDSAKWTADVARNVASTALSAAKWATFSAIASGFGLGGLGASASTVRRTSQGLGIRAGELRAANVNFGKYIDPEATLGNIAGAQSDLSKRWIFNALGENTAGKDAAQILPEILPKLIQAFKAGGSTLQGAQGRGLDQLVGIDDLRRLSVLTEEELSKTIDAYKKDRQALEEGDSTGRAWQDFMVALHRAGDQIEVSLLKGLTKLTPYLEAFANGIAKAIDTFVSSGGLQQWIEKVGAALQKLGSYLGSKEFATDVESFMSAIHAMAATIGKLFPKTETGEVQANAAPAPHASSATGAAMNLYRAAWDHLVGNDRVGRIKSLGEKYGLPAGTLDDVWRMESGRGANNGLSRAGAGGDFQIIPGVASSYGVKDRWNFEQSSDAAARMLRDLLKHYGGDVQKSLAGYNWGMGNVDKDIARNGSDWLAHAPAETQKYVAGGIHIKIENQTGGSAQATVAALAH